MLYHMSGYSANQHSSIISKTLKYPEGAKSPDANMYGPSVLLLACYLGFLENPHVMRPLFKKEILAPLRTKVVSRAPRTAS